VARTTAAAWRSRLSGRRALKLAGGFAPRAVLAQEQFRRLYVASVAANVARWIEMFALGWLAVQLAIRDGRPELGAFYLGLVGLARFVPAATFGLIGGVSADRFDRRTVLTITRVVSGVIATGIAALTLTGRIEIVTLMILTAISASAFAFDGPAVLSLGPLLVPRQHTLSVIALMRATMQFSMLLGPLIAGVLIGPLGVGGVLVLVALLYGFSRLMLGRMDPAPPDLSNRHPSALGSMVVALAYVWREPTLRGFMSATIVFGSMGSSLTQLLPAVAHDTFNVGATELSYLAAALAVGALTGALITTTMRGWPRPGLFLLAAGTALGVMLVAFGLQRELVPAIGVAALVGTASMTYNGGMGNMVHTTVVDHMRGRVVGLQITMFQSGAHLGTLILGTLGTFIGVSNAVIVAGVVIITTSLALSFNPAVRDARVPVHAPIGGDALAD
jgi:MFS family permease